MKKSEIQSRDSDWVHYDVSLDNLSQEATIEMQNQRTGWTRKGKLDKYHDNAVVYFNKRTYFHITYIGGDLRMYAQKVLTDDELATMRNGAFEKRVQEDTERLERQKQFLPGTIDNVIFDLQGTDSFVLPPTSKKENDDGFTIFGAFRRKIE